MPLLETITVATVAGAGAGTVNPNLRSQILAGFSGHLCVIAIILLVPALASGIVARTPLSFPILFMGLGILLGGNFLGFIDMDARSPTLEVVATFTLSLVLFLDAINLQVDQLGRRWLIPALILGPGTAIIIALGAVPLALLLGFGWIMAFLGGAILASTDPVVLRELMRDRRIPRSIKQILKIEAGTNDLIVLPIILILIAVGQPRAERQVSGPCSWSNCSSRGLPSAASSAPLAHCW